MKSLSKKSISIFLIFTMLIALILPTIVNAEGESYTITFTATDDHTMENDNGHLKIDGQYVDLKNGENTIGVVNCSSATSASITVNNGTTGKLNYFANGKFTLYNTAGHVPHNIEDEINSDIVFMVEDYTNPDNGSTNNYNQDFENIEFDIVWTNAFINLWINERSVIEESQDFHQTNFEYNNVIVEKAGNITEDKTNELRLQPRFGDKALAECTINGVKYDENSNNVAIDGDIWTITVPGATKYTISGVADQNAAQIRTIIWANVDADKTAENFDEDMILEHGKAKIIAIYDENNTKIAGPIDVDVNTGMGWVPVDPGNKVIFEFVPEYGYQLTSVKANGFALEPQAEINQYTFIMPDTNIHFQAIFTPTNDVLEANSSKVNSGEIELGNGLEGGSAKLTVNDIELTSDKIKGFENSAGNYKISNYLDIDLYNIFYKGKEDSDDVWSNKIDELEKEATITLKLEDGIDANDIVLVHNVHDGDTYEIIQIDSYDPVTNTITFRTKSFSNYAIALKENLNTKTSPKTGDDIILWISIMTVSTLGILVICKNLRKKD